MVLLDVWAGGIWIYIGGRSTSVEQRGAHEGGGRAWGVGAPPALCLLRLELALVFPEEEGMMQQSSVSISLIF